MKIRAPSASANIHDVTDCLAEALVHLHRSAYGSGYRRSYIALRVATAGLSRGGPHRLILSRHGQTPGKRLTPETLVEAVGHAYAVALAVEQFGSDLGTLLRMLRVTLNDSGRFARQRAGSKGSRPERLLVQS